MTAREERRLRNRHQPEEQAELLTVLEKAQLTLGDVKKSV
jgi:hypothetical protein